MNRGADSMSTRGTLWLVARQEWRMLIADWSLPLVIGLLVALITYGFANGLAEVRTRDAMVETVLQAEADAGRAQLERFDRIASGQELPSPFNNPANPAIAGNGSGRQTVLPSAALAPIAIGQSDMMPNYYRIGTRSKVEFMYDSEIESPWNLLSGHFDLSFVIVFLLPLLIFALSFNLLSAERESGTERMLLSQPLGLGTLALGKLIPRAVPLLTVAALLPVMLLLLFRPEARALPAAGLLLGWAAIVGLYGLFWFALAFAVNCLRRSSSANALMLIAGWTVLVLVVPVLLNLAVEHLHPAPSRTELSIRTRAIQADNLRRYDDLFSGDYRYIDEPESLQARDGRIEIPARTMASFLARRDMDKRVDGLLDSFDSALSGQQAAADRLSFLSPAALTYEALTAIAGTDGRRYLAFRQDVSRFHDGWRARFEPLIIGGIAVTRQDLEQLPRWDRAAQQQAGVGRALLLPAALLALLTLAFALIGTARLRRYTVA